MKLGVYNAILHDRPLPEALRVIAGLGLTGIESDTGGFLPGVHVPTMDQIPESDTARDDCLAIFEGSGGCCSPPADGDGNWQRPRCHRQA